MSAAGIGYAAAVATAIIFLVAALAKLRNINKTAQEFDDLGLRHPEFFARIVPFAEIAITALLIIVPAVGAIAAMVTLAFFTTFLVGRLRKGVRAPCACFGAISNAPLGPSTIVRNVLFFVLAATSLLATKPVSPSVVDVVVVVIALLIGVGLVRFTDIVIER